MRITVLQQQVKTLKDEQPEVGEKVARELESTKHFLCHRNTLQALQLLECLFIDLEFPKVPSPLTSVTPDLRRSPFSGILTDGPSSLQYHSKYTTFIPAH
jgi:hypothetical protein